jgi:hypothetical protein
VWAGNRAVIRGTTAPNVNRAGGQVAPDPRRPGAALRRTIYAAAPLAVLARSARSSSQMVMGAAMNQVE